MSSQTKHRFLTLCFLLTISLGSHLAFDDELEDDHTTETHPPTGKLPKDKVLLKNVEKLVFLRNKRTTSRRTHSIHQLSCVGGTAGCKLFTPDVSATMILSNAHEIKILTNPILSHRANHTIG